MTEFTSADGLSRMRETKRRRYLTFYDDEHPIGAQLFGSNPETLAEAARIVRGYRFRYGRPESRLPGQARRGLQRRLGAAARSAAESARSSAPFATPSRFPSPSSSASAGTNRRLCAWSLRKMAEAEGLNGLALHARTREQGYSGQAQWGWIAR